MSKKIKLGNYEPTLTGVKVIGVEEKDIDNPYDKVLFNHTDEEYGVVVEADMNQLAQSVAWLNAATHGKTSASDFVSAMIKTSPDILEDQVFDIAKVALKACLSRVSKQEGMYYHPLAAALAVCEDIIENQ